MAVRARRRPAMTPFKAGLLAVLLVAVFSFFGFTKYNPFAHPFMLHATFESANNLQPKSPVRMPPSRGPEGEFWTSLARNFKAIAKRASEACAFLNSCFCS